MIRSYDKKYLKIALPAALEGLFMILLASADLIMVGTLGAVSIAAVSIFLQPRLVILCFTRSLASSVTLLVSRDAGRNDRTNASDILKKSIFIGAIVLLFIHSIFYLFLEDIFYLMGAKTEYMAEALAYGNIALLSVFYFFIHPLFPGSPAWLRPDGNHHEDKYSGKYSECHHEFHPDLRHGADSCHGCRRRGNRHGHKHHFQSVLDDLSYEKRPPS